MRDGSGVGRAFHFIGIFGCVAGYVAHNVDERVECIDRLGFGWLDHERLVEQQREIDCGGMESVVEQTLSYVHGGDTI